MEMVDGLSLIISLVAILVSIFTFGMTIRWERKQATIEAYMKLQEDLFFIYEYKNAEEIELFVNDSTTTEYKVLSSSLAALEAFAICTFNGTYNKLMVYKLAHGFIDGTLFDKIECLLEMKKSRSGKEYYPYTRKLLRWMTTISGNSFFLWHML